MLPEPLTEAIVQPQPEPELPETPPQDLVEPQPILTEPEVEESSVGEWFAWLAPSSVSDAQEEAGPTAAGGQPSLGEDSGATESDEEILAWVERFGSWAREKVPDEPVSPQLKIPEPQSEEASPAVVNQLDELARSEEKLLGADSSAPIAERLGEVTRPDEVWKDLDQDDYCPDDDNGAEQPVQTPQEPIAERLGDVVRPDEVWKDLDQDDHCPRDVEDLDEEVSYFNRTSRV